MRSLIDLARPLTHEYRLFCSHFNLSWVRCESGGNFYHLKHIKFSRENEKGFTFHQPLTLFFCSPSFMETLLSARTTYVTFSGFIVTVETLNINTNTLLLAYCRISCYYLTSSDRQNLLLSVGFSWEKKRCSFVNMYLFFSVTVTVTPHLVTIVHRAIFSLSLSHYVWQSSDAL